MDKMSRLSPVDSHSLSSFKSLSKVISLFVFGVGCLVLIGWALDIAALKSILPGLASMKSNTALLFILCGISLWTQVRGQPQPIAQICAFIVAFVALLTLGEYLFNRDLGIDQLLFRDTAVDVLPGRMAPATALSFLLIGLAMIFLDNQSSNWFNKFFVIATFAISALALIGYLYGVSALYEIGEYISMAWHTALNFVLLSISILFARPERGLMQTILADTPGGNILRRFLPVAIVTPLLLGWIILEGERAGFYDTAFEVALMVVSIITMLTIFIWFNARQLTYIDITRRQMDDRLHASEQFFRSTLENMMEGCQIIGYDWRTLFINSSAEKHNRRPNKELLGNIYMDMWPGIESTDMFAALRLCMEERTPQRMLNEFTYPDGSLGWFEIGVQPVPDGIFILSSDITEHRRAEAELLKRERKLTTLFELLPVGISILDAERKVTYTNPALKRILDISEEGLLKGTYRNRKYLRADGTLMPADELASMRAFKEKREIDVVETGVVKENDDIVWTNVSAVPVDFPDWKLVMITSDITERKQAGDEIVKLNANLEGKVAERTSELAEANKRLLELSIIDELTGLYNRRGFILHAEQQLLLARRTKHDLIVFYADLDGLKQTNDHFGHTAGDEAIVTAARILHETFRTSDIKARLGGDEFIVLAIEAKEHDTQSLLSRLHAMLAENHQTMSVGVVTVDAQNETSIEDLIVRADEAMYIEKRKKPSKILH
ncbi:MAG: sensor domain-containing diguanylate cyclase [Anaerolineales bacterium]